MNHNNMSSNQEVLPKKLPKDDIINMYKDAMRGGDLNNMAQYILNNNPDIKAAVDRNHGNFKDAFLEECRNKNLNPMNILSMLK